MATQQQLEDALQNAAAQYRSTGDESIRPKLEALSNALREMKAAQGTSSVGVLKSNINPAQQREVYDMDAKEEPGSWLDPLLSGATFGHADEAMAGIANTYAKMHALVTGEPNDVTISSATQKARDDYSAYAEREPGTALGLELAGGFATGVGGGAKVMGSQFVKQMPKLMKAGALAATSGAEAGLYGFGVGEGLDDSLEQAGSSAWKGAIAGPLMNWGGDKLMRWYQTAPAKKIMEKVAKTLSRSDLKKKAQHFYDKLDDSGFVINSDYYNSFKTKLSDEIDNTGASTTIMTEIEPALKEIRGLTHPTFKDLEKAKSKLRNAKTSATEGVRAAANKISNSIDDMVAGLQPFHVIKGSVDDVKDSINQAKGYWSRHAQMDTLDDLKREARFSEAEVMYGDYDKAMRDVVRPIVTSDRKQLGMDELVVTKLEDMIEGDMGKSFARMLAKMNPGEATGRGPAAVATGIAAGVLSEQASEGTGIITGSITAVLPMLAGLIGRKKASKITRKQLKEIENLIINKDQPTFEKVIQKLIHSSINDAASVSVGGNIENIMEGIGRYPPPENTNPTNLMDMVQP